MYNLCVSELRSKYIIQNLRGIPISAPLLNSCHWTYKDEDNDAFVAKLKTPKTIELGLSAMYETKRVHMEKAIKKAHELSSEILLNKCNEGKEIQNIIKIFKLNESEEPCIKLEVALAISPSQTLLPTAQMLVKNKNLDALSEKIISIDKVLELIEKAIISHQNYTSKCSSNTRMMNIFDIAIE